ncbi:MAG TPA: hypothetical protein PKL13_01715 [bacterium]|nr:hypothetical protein [bacterium]
MVRSQIQIENELSLLMGDELFDEIVNYVNNLETEQEKSLALELISERDEALFSRFYEGNASHTAFPK